jgi:hypothetical protein
MVPVAQATNDWK